MKNFILFGLATLATLSITKPAHSSALIEKDELTNTIRVIARMVYSGPALTEAIAESSTREIQDMWSEVPTEVMVGAKIYRVEFDIDYVMVGSQTLVNPDSCAYNFIQVKPKSSAGDRSYYAGLGSRNGVFYTSDDLGNSTTAAHEFGHGLMLDHNDLDQRTAEVPGIMFARGTFVRPEFQWNPSAPAGAAGGTINPKYRKVRAADIKAIPFFAVSGIFTQYQTCLGQGTAKAIK